MIHHDTESRLLFARERADLLANEMLAASAGADLPRLTRQVLRRQAAVRLELGQAHRKRARNAQRPGRGPDGCSSGLRISGEIVNR
jgi:hypothetical protein